MVEVQLKSTVKTIRSENDPKYIMPNLYSFNRILHQTSCVESPKKMEGYGGNINTF